MHFWQKDEFRQEAQKWKKILSESGFDDIEIGDKLKQNSSNSYRQQTKLQRESKIEYFRTITHKANQNKTQFLNKHDLTVMTMRGDGYKIQDVARACGLHRQTIRFIIRRYEHQWGIRLWTLKQRNLKHEPNV